MTNINSKMIAEYIVKHFPDSSFSNDIQKGFYDEEVLVEEGENLFYYKKLNWCGCGQPEEAKRVIRDYL